LSDSILLISALEKQAELLYYACAKNIETKNREFADFLAELARDEKWHYDLLQEILVLYETVEEKPVFDVNFDKEIMDYIMQPFVELQGHLDEDSLTEEVLAGLLVKMEESEWNSLFLYIVQIFSDHLPQFTSIMARLENHLNFIEHDLAKVVPGIDTGSLFGEVKGQLWQPKVLIIDDNRELARMLQKVLARIGSATLCFDADEGLKLLSENDYDVILTDIDLPGISGFELYNRLVLEYPEKAGRVIMMSGYPFHRDKLPDQSITMLDKPFNLTDIIKAVEAMGLKKHGTRKHAD
jgi:CheY-like chemotaxis protein